MLEASTELHIALADAEGASVHYVTNRSEDVDLWEAFRATGALPILYNRFVKVGDRLYLDGSLSDGLPLPRLPGARVPLHRGRLDETAVVPESAGEPARSHAGLVGDAPVQPGTEARPL